MADEAKTPWAMIVAALFVAFLIVNVVMYIFLSKIRTDYMIPYYQMQAHMDSLMYHDSTGGEYTPDSLAMAMENLATDFLDARRSGDSLRTLASKQGRSLQQLEREVDEYRTRELTLSDEQLTRLSTIFGRMKPQNAAPIMQRMDDDAIIAILMQIQERQAAKIMSNMAPGRAARITKTIQEEVAKKYLSAKEQS